MNKEQFLSAICERLQTVSALERQKALDYYAEMIDDRVEDGMSEEQAVAALGDIDEILGGFDIPAAPQKMSRGRLATVLSLAIITVPLLFAAYAVIWSLVVTVYALIVGLFALGAAVVGLIVKYVVEAELIAVLMSVGVGLVSAGAIILCIKAADSIARDAVYVTKMLWRLVFFGRVSK